MPPAACASNVPLFRRAVLAFVVPSRSAGTNRPPVAPTGLFYQLALLRRVVDALFVVNFSGHVPCVWDWRLPAAPGTGPGSPARSANRSKPLPGSLHGVAPAHRCPLPAAFLTPGAASHLAQSGCPPPTCPGFHPCLTWGLRAPDPSRGAVPGPCRLASSSSSWSASSFVCGRKSRLCVRPDCVQAPAAGRGSRPPSFSWCPDERRSPTLIPARQTTRASRPSGRNAPVWPALTSLARSSRSWAWPPPSSAA